MNACNELGIEPNIITKEFSNPLEEQLYIVETNLQRRELNQFQRAELALKLRPIAQEIAKKNMSEGGKGSRILKPFHTDKELAKVARVCTFNLRQAERVIKSGNQDMILDARAGRRTINNAAGHVQHEENIARSKAQYEARQKQEPLPNAVKCIRCEKYTTKPSTNPDKGGYCEDCAGKINQYFSDHKSWLENYHRRVDPFEKRLRIITKLFKTGKPEDHKVEWEAEIEKIRTLYMRSTSALDGKPELYGATDGPELLKKFGLEDVQVVLKNDVGGSGELL